MKNCSIFCPFTKFIYLCFQFFFDSFSQTKRNFLHPLCPFLYTYASNIDCDRHHHPHHIHRFARVYSLALTKFYRYMSVSADVQCVTLASRVLCVIYRLSETKIRRYE